MSEIRFLNYNSDNSAVKDNSVKDILSNNCIFMIHYSEKNIRLLIHGGDNVFLNYKEGAELLETARFYHNHCIVMPGCSKKDIQPFYEGIIFHHLSKNLNINSMWISGTSECLMNVFENLNISSYSLFISDRGEIFDNVIERVRRSRHISEINLYCSNIWHEYGITSIPEKIYGLGEIKEPSTKNKIMVSAIEQCEMNFLNNFA